MEGFFPAPYREWKIFDFESRCIFSNDVICDFINPNEICFRLIVRGLGLQFDFSWSLFSSADYNQTGVRRQCSNTPGRTHTTCSTSTTDWNGSWWRRRGHRGWRCVAVGFRRTLCHGVVVVTMKWSKVTLPCVFLYVEQFRSSSLYGKGRWLRRVSVFYFQTKVEVVGIWV